MRYENATPSVYPYSRIYPDVIYVCLVIISLNSIDGFLHNETVELIIQVNLKNEFKFLTFLFLLLFDKHTV